MTSSITYKLVPTGGAISLTINASGTAMTFSRAVSGVSGIGAYTQLYSGAPIPLYIDAGDLLPAPLVSGATYVYKLVDANGTTQTSGINPYAQLNIEQEPLLALMIRLLQAAFNNLVPPAGVTPCQVLQCMPLAGIPPMPFVTVNLDLFQQGEIPIGQNVQNYDNQNSTWTITGFAKRIFRISVLATNTADRDYYRDATVAMLESIINSVFLPLGLDIRHSYQAASGQVAKSTEQMNPGFYYCDVMLTVEGTFNISIVTTYGQISVITFDAYTPDGEDSISVVVPP